MLSKFSRHQIEQIRRVFKQTGGDKKATADICKVQPRSVEKYTKAVDSVSTLTATNPVITPSTDTPSNVPTAEGKVSLAAQKSASEPSSIGGLLSQLRHGLAKNSKQRRLRFLRRG